MNADNVVPQLIKLSKKYVDTGESEEQLREHFMTEFKNGEIRYAMRGDRVTAFVDWAWISCREDIEKADAGDPTSGEILFVMNYVIDDKELTTWKLRHLLPPHHWIVWKENGEIHAPKGWPDAISKVA